VKGYAPIPGKVLGAPPTEGTAVKRPIDTSTLGPIKVEDREVLTKARLAEMVRTLKPGERIAFTRLPTGRIKVDRELTS
jgi:hypothetical protein